MKNFFAMLVLMFSVGLAYADGGPTKDIIQPGQGVNAANEYCLQKYPEDKVMQGACFIVLGGAVLNAKSGKGFQFNIPLEKPVLDDVNRPAGRLMKCKAKLVLLSGNNIGWEETPDCRYQ